MGEKIRLDTPAALTVTDYSVGLTTLRRLPSPSVRIIVVNNLGQDAEFNYEGEAARQLLNKLNTMDFSVDSFEKRILERLIADGHLPGTVEGTPDRAEAVAVEK